MTHPTNPPTISAHALWLRAVRKDRGLTQSDVADALGVSQATISNAERGHRDLSPGVAHRLAAKLAEVDENGRPVWVGVDRAKQPSGGEK